MLSGMNYFDYRTQREVPGAVIRLTRIDLSEPADALFRQDEGYWIDYSLTPRPADARGCFSDERRDRHFQPFGNVFVVPPGRTLHARSGAGEHVSLLCVLHEEHFRRWLDRDFCWTARHLDASVDLRAPSVQTLLQRLGEEIHRPGLASDILCEAITLQLAVELCRHYGAISERSEPGGLAGWRLKLVEERVREVGNPPTLVELADMCGLSIRQLARGFRATRGRSLGAYIAESRIDRAKRMLCNGDRVKAVAFTLGFASPSSFCYAFRRATGQSPRQFRLFAGPV